MIAVILIMSFVFSLMPFSAYATEFAPVEEQENDYETIVEIEEKRERNVKHFLLPDGSYEAVVYTDAVHRKDWAFSSCMKKKKRQKFFETDKFFVFSIVIY